MSDLGFNKIAFCVLGTGLALIGLNEASHAFFHEEHHEKPGYFVEVPEAPAAGVTPVAEGPRDYFKIVGEGSVEAGKLVAAKCQQCHKFEAGADFTGPSLFGIMGKDIASEPGFKYSTGPGSLTEQEGVWTYEKFDHFIERPRKAVPATAMNFAGLNKQKDRGDLMAYLRTLTTGEQLPLPEPLPPPAEAPAAPADGTAPADGASPATPAPGTPAPAGASPASNPGAPASTGATSAPGGVTAPKPAAPAQPQQH